jgi:hypothetical protein
MKVDVGLVAGVLTFVFALPLGLAAIAIIEREKSMLALYRQVFFVAMVLRFAASLAIYTFGFVDVLGDEDASAWQGAAAIYADWIHRDLALADLPSVWVAALRHPMSIIGYQYTIATLFFVTGTASRLMAAVLNNFCGAMTVVLAARVGTSLFSPWVGSRVGWWACLFPSLVVWSAQTVKEPVVIFLETVALYACTRLRGSGAGLRHVLVCAGSIVLLVAFRFYAAYVTGAVIFLTLALPHIRSGRSRVGAALAVSALVVPALVLTGALAAHEQTLQVYDLTHLQTARDWTARHTGSGVPLGYDLGTPSGMALSIAVGSAHLLLAPFPWEFGRPGLRTLLTLPELVVWWWLACFAVLPGLRIALRARFAEVQPLLCFILGMGIVYGATFSNVGLVFRQRAQLLPWLLVFAAVGLEQRRVNALARRRAGSVRHGSLPSVAIKGNATFDGASVTHAPVMVSPRLAPRGAPS